MAPVLPRALWGGDMANFFDQFDTPQAGDTQAQGGNYFDQFDQPAGAKGGPATEGAPLKITVRPERAGAEPVPASPQYGGGFFNATAGLNEAVYDTLGLPVDLATGAVNLGIRGVNAATGAGIKPLGDLPGGSRSIANAFGAIGVPDPANVQATTAGEKLARAAGQGAGYMIAPEFAVRGATQVLSPAAARVIQALGSGSAPPASAAAPQLSPVIEALIGSSRSAPEALGNAAVGALAGATGSAAAQVVPEPYRPLAEIGGNLLGGGIGAVATNIPAMAREGARMASDYFAPLTAGGRERIAGEAIRDAASDPYAVRDALANAPAALVPGSQPTTFQQTGDLGLGGLERTAQTRAPELFAQRRADQNVARIDALGALQPQGSSEAVVGVLRQNLAAIDRSTGDALQLAQMAARERTAALGGTSTPESYGSTLRQTLTEAEQATRARERALWGAVDPDGTLALDVAGIRDEARGIVKGLPQSARGIEGEEAGIIGAASRYADVMPFREVTALRSRVSTEMRRELSQNGQTPVYARLAQLRGAIERTIEDAVAGKAGQEAEAVAAGAMRPEDTILAQWERKRQEWYDVRTANAGAETVGLSGGNARAGSTTFPSALGAGSQGRSGSANFAGPSGVSGALGGSGLTPNFDAAALERLRQANDATKARAQTYGRGPVGDVLRRSGQDGPYNVPSSVVPSRFFRPGPRGSEDVQTLRQAANSPEAMASIRDYAVSTLRRAAEEPDGTLNPAKVAAWQRQHADALRAFPEIADMVADPVRASETMARLAAERKQALDAYQSGMVGRLLGVSDTADITKAISGVFTSQAPVKVMRQLAQEAAGNPEAVAGLRKAVADHIANRFVSNVEVGASGQAGIRVDAFQQFIRQNEAALREVFSAEEVATLQAIAADIQRAQRSLTAVRIPGQSNTAQDVLGTVSRDRNASMFTRLLAAAGPGIAAGTVAGSLGTGLAVAIGSSALMSARKAGLQSVDDIITDAMLNPARARLLLKAAGSPREAADVGRALAESYHRSAKVPVMNSADEDLQFRPAQPTPLLPYAPSTPSLPARSDAGTSGPDLAAALAQAVRARGEIRPILSDSARRVARALIGGVAA